MKRRKTLHGETLVIHEGNDGLRETGAETEKHNGCCGENDNDECVLLRLRQDIRNKDDESFQRQRKDDADSFVGGNDRVHAENSYSTDCSHKTVDRMRAGQKSKWN